LRVQLAVPEGTYDAEAVVTPIARMPWLFGFTRWLRKSFVSPAPRSFARIGSFHAGRDGIAVAVPPEVARWHHVVALRLTPPGAIPGRTAAPIDEKQREQLKALGYVQ